jgi:competence protein ComFC
LKALPLVEGALDLLFPRRCLGCGREGAYLCAACTGNLPRILPPFCSRCGLPVTGGSECSCQDDLGSLDGLRSPFRFEGTIRLAVHALKYQNLRALSGTLAGFLHSYLSTNPLPADQLLPVPLHLKKLRQRGYNQSQLIAARLGDSLRLPVNTSTLVRVKRTSSQATSQSVEQRRQNVQDAFACADGKTRGQRVVIIDDVATSGATLAACAAALKEAGAISVWGLTLAREI